MGNADRQETRSEIFESVLSEFLRDQAPVKAFRWILRGSDIFARRLKEGLAIYLAEHSPEKLAEEAKHAAMEFSEKLEKIIGGLEAKSLSIPAALLLAAKEVEQGAGLTTLNGIVALSAVIFGITMTTAADGEIKTIHDRRPVALDPSQALEWINFSEVTADGLVQQVVPAEAIRFFPVSRPLAIRGGMGRS